jgi:molybdate transport system substrate-binding protein
MEECVKYRIYLIVMLAAFLFQTGCSSQASETLVDNQPTVMATSQGSSDSGTLMVFAAGSLTQPFTELGALFEAQNSGMKVSFNFQNANTLAQQIGQDAPADVFASAAEKYMTDAVATGRINNDDVIIFARNKLVVIIPKDNPANIQTLQDLAKPGIKLVMGAKEGPQGIYVENFLSNAVQDSQFSPQYKDLVYQNVVSYESTVNAVVTKVSLGEADAGIVFFSDSQGSAVDKVNILEIPDSLNIEARYPIAPLNDSQNLKMAKAFVDFVLSSSGQEVLNKYGFLAP